MKNQRIPGLRKHSGISLYVIIVLVMLSMLLALWASRTSLFNEMIVGNDSDYQRAFEAAQALIQDAELDIRGQRPDGSTCVAVPGNPSICRVQDSANKVWIPTEDQEVGLITATLDASTTGCIAGICLKRTGNQNFWSDSATLTAMMAENVGARYGRYTGAQAGASSNPILKLNQPTDNAQKGGWYWIEMMPYDPASGNSGLITNGSDNLPLNLAPNVAYRITAIAHGLKPSTQVVLQSTFVRQKFKN